MKVNASLQVLSGISVHLLKPLSPEDTYAMLLREAKKAFGIASGSIFLRYRASWHRVYSTVPQDGQVTPRARGFSYKVFATQSPMLVRKKLFVSHHPEAKHIAMETLLIVPLSYGGRPLGIMALRTVTIKTLTKKLRHGLLMYSSLATLAIKNTQLYEESKEALRIRDLFISLAAHELRTPLTAINVYTQLLLRKLRVLNFPYLQWAQELSDETSHLIRLVNELLNVDLIQHGVFFYQMKPVLLADVVQRAVRQFSLTNPLFSVHIKNHVQPSGKIIADPDKLLELFTCILQNAGKFSQEKKDIEITIEEKPKTVSIIIQDNGVGILTKDKGKIFEAFYKGNNATYEGMGLGLFLSKRIVEKHNGTIVIAPRKSRGTSVVVTFPRKTI